MKNETEIEQSIELLEKSRDGLIAQANRDLAFIEGQIAALKQVLNPQPVAQDEPVTQ